MNALSFVAFLTLIAVVGNGQDKEKQELTVVPEVDLTRYVGTWYEVARLPNTFQKQCVGDVTATYTVMEDGDIQVVNRCRTADGTMSEATGRAKRASDSEPNTKLKVRFAPAFLSFLPFVWGDYWIIVLAQDYSYAVIGEPDRKYLWVLSRTPSLEDTTLQGILEQVKQKGYDLTGLVNTKNAPR